MELNTQQNTPKGLNVNRRTRSNRTRSKRTRSNRSSSNRTRKWSCRIPNPWTWVACLLISLNTTLAASKQAPNQADSTHENASAERNTASPKTAQIVQIDLAQTNLEPQKASKKSLNFSLRDGTQLDIPLKPIRIFSPNVKVVRGSRTGEQKPIDFRPDTVNAWISSDPQQEAYIYNSNRLTTGFLRNPNAQGRLRNGLHLSHKNHGGTILPPNHVSVFPAQQRDDQPDVPLCGLDHHDHAHHHEHGHHQKYKYH
ncbi:MAG: hypothetical protein ACPGXK_13825, partial [Phycisphaerae bacterium]